MICCLAFLSGTKLRAQATFDGSGLYTQNFGTGTISSWTNNSTFGGWYFIQNFTNSDFPPAAANFGVTTSTGLGSPGLNTGGNYTYKCGTNNLIGSRPSNASGGTGSACASGFSCGHSIGLRLRNNTGATINSLQISYTGLQMTTAGNGNVQSDWRVYYATGATVSAVSTATTEIASLAYSAPNNDPSTSSGAQFSRTFCTVSSLLSHCLAVTIPAGEEIMLRWSDANNSNNDPHLAIDDISVQAYTDASCTTTPLPVTLLHFNAKNQGTFNHLTWTTTKEINNAGFVIERSLDGTSFETLGFVDGYGNGQGPFQYAYTDFTFANQASYYRLVQKDDDGTLTYYPVRYVSGEKDLRTFSVYPNPTTDYLYLEGLSQTEEYFSLQLINQQGTYTSIKGAWVNDTYRIATDNLSAGHYILQLTTNGEVVQFPIIIGE